MGSVVALFRNRPQAKLAAASKTPIDQTSAASGSWPAFTAAAIASLLLVFSACSLNAGYAWTMGINEGPFKAAVLAGAAVGAAILTPMGFLVTTRGKGLGTRAVALLLAVACLGYTAVSSLGTIAGARDAGVAKHSTAVEAHQDRRALVEAARKELDGLKGTRADILERKSELTAILVDLTTSKPGHRPSARPDSQAAALGFYLRAAGWQVEDAAVGTWLSLGMVLVLEAGAALGLTVAAALYPVRPQRIAANDGTEPQRKPGRPPINGKPMSSTERSRRSREKRGERVSLH